MNFEKEVMITPEQALVHSNQMSKVIKEELLHIKETLLRKFDIRETSIKIDVCNKVILQSINFIHVIKQVMKEHGWDCEVIRTNSPTKYAAFCWEIKVASEGK
jgi:hypothetical protein